MAAEMDEREFLEALMNVVRSFERTACYMQGALHARLDALPPALPTSPERHLSVVGKEAS